MTVQINKFFGVQRPQAFDKIRRENTLHKVCKIRIGVFVQQIITLSPHRNTIVGVLFELRRRILPEYIVRDAVQRIAELIRQLVHLPWVVA